MTRARTTWFFALGLLVGILASLFGAAPADADDRAPATAASTARTGSARDNVTDALPCSACHTTDGWKTRATTSEEGGFDHSKTGFPLTGLHVGAACASCHVPGRPTPKRDCIACHSDFHRGRLSTSCDRCHSALGWKVTRPIEIHRMTRLPLTGMHAIADCAECHKRASEHQWSSTPVDCFGCHEKDYMRPNLEPPHQGPGITPFPRDCSLCHRAMSWVPAFVRITQTGVAPGALRAGAVAPPGHDVKFPISFGVHRTATCPDCHASQTVPQAVRCIGCHAHEPTRLALQHKQSTATLGTFCIGCHVGGARR